MTVNVQTGPREESLMMKNDPENQAHIERVRRIVEAIDTLSAENRLQILNLIGSRPGRRTHRREGIIPISRKEAIRQSFMMYADDELIDRHGEQFGIPSTRRVLQERADELFGLSPETIGKIEELLGRNAQRNEPSMYEI